MMMLLIFLVSFFSFEKTSSPPPEKIRWEDSRRLAFADFKGDVPAVTPWAATTSSEINFYYESVNNKLTKVVVYASFNQEKSWMKKRLPEVLSHEQLHFDITEVFARKFYHEVLKKNTADKKELNNLFQKVNNECQQTQHDYDDATDHGVVEDAQAKWSEKVAAMLKDEEPYPGSE